MRPFHALVVSLLFASSATAQEPGSEPREVPTAPETAPPSAPAAQPASAQPEPQPRAVPTGPPETVTPMVAGRAKGQEEVVVTGSRLRRKDLTTPAPVTVVTREQIQDSGKLTVADFLQSLPEQGNAPNFQLNNGGATYGADGSTRMNLRSLGITRTLVLVNGRRMVPAGLGASPAVDLNSIPTAAVERIEILKDGASAIYGSDAIAGVVNIITRKSFEGTEASVMAGISGHGDAPTFEATAMTGRATENGNLLFSVGYFYQGQSWLRDRPWSAQALTWDYTLQKAVPGGSYRTPQGTIGLPADANGNPLPDCLANALCRGLVQSDPNWTNDAFIRDPSAPLGWRVMTNADRYNFAAENYLTIPSSRFQAYSAGDTHLGPVRGFYEASYVHRDSEQNAAPMPLNPGDYTLPGSNIPIEVSKYSMYNPFGVDLPFAGRRLVEFGHRRYDEDLGTFRAVTGLDGGLGPLHNWFWDVSMNYGRTDGTFTTHGAIRNSRIADAVGPSMVDANGVPRCVSTPGDLSTAIPGCVPLNLFGGPNNGSIDPSQIQWLGFDGTSRASDALFAVNGNLNGELFSLASDRPVGLALGYEFRRQSGAQIADPIAASGDSADFNFKSTQGSYVVHEGYAELSIPIVSQLPMAENLEADVAGRVVSYSTFGTNLTYKVGGRYTPVRDITLRGTYSTAFRAPSINELYLGQSETAPVATDPCNFNAASAPPALVAQCEATGVPAGGSGDRGQQQLAHVGGNPALKPETARTFTAGVVLEPRFLSGFSLTADYYSITVDNVIGDIGVPAILAGCYPGETGTPYEPYCGLITRAPDGRILYVTDVNQNVGTLSTAGIDIAARYGLPTRAGRFGAMFDGTWLQYYDRTQPIGLTSQTIHGVGNFDLGALPAVRFNLGVDWSLVGIHVAAILRYVGSFKECGSFDSSSGDYLSAGGLCYAGTNLPSRQVGTYVVADLNAGYALKTVVGTTTFTIGVNNVTDRPPPYVYSAPLANSDPATYDFLGRYFYSRVAQRF